MRRTGWTSSPKLPTDSGRAVKTTRHIFDYVFTDWKNEQDLVALLDRWTEIELYAKLSKAFTIPTPVVGYTSDWRIAFKLGAVKHVDFVADEWLNVANRVPENQRSEERTSAEILQPDHVRAGEVWSGEQSRQAHGAGAAVSRIRLRCASSDTSTSVPSEFRHYFAELPRGINRGSPMGETAKLGLDALIFVKKYALYGP